MENDLKKMLDTLYEAQALVEMALRNRDSAKTTMKLRLVADKCALLAEMSHAWNLPEHADELPDPTYTPYSGFVDDFNAEGEDEAEAEAEIEEEMSETDLRDKAATDSFDEPDNEEEAGMDEEVDVEEDKDDAVDGTDEDDAVAVPIVSVGPEPVPVRPVNTPPAPPMPAKPCADKSARQASAPPVKSAPPKPLLSFFTINDRFRFRRSLFGGDNLRFLEAISETERLGSADEAERLFASKYSLDPEAPETKLFMKPIRRYFKTGN